MADLDSGQWARARLVWLSAEPCVRQTQRGKQHASAPAYYLQIEIAELARQTRASRREHQACYLAISGPGGMQADHGPTPGLLLVIRQLWLGSALFGADERSNRQLLIIT